MSWNRKFDKPITLPDGRAIRTLKEAGEYLLQLPKRKHDHPAVQAAAEALQVVVEHGAPPMIAEIGMRKMLSAIGSRKP